MRRHAGAATILYLGHTALPGGAELCLVRLMRALDRTRVRPIVILAEDGPIAAQLRSAGAETYVIPLDGAVRAAGKDTIGAAAMMDQRRIAAVAGYAGRIAAFARKNNVDMIHTNSMKAHFYGSVAGWMAGIPVVWHVRDFVNPSYLPRPAVALVRAFARMAPRRVIAVSQAVLDELRLGICARKGAVVHDGLTKVELDQPAKIESGPKDRTVMFALVGRLMPWKGQHVFLDAAAKVVAAGHKAKFLIIGAPFFGQEPYEKKLLEQRAKLGLDSHVSFLGFRSDVPELLKSVDVLVHASTSGDPLPGTVLEGHAAGIAVIGTRGGGVPDMIEDGATGLLVAMGDADDMARAMIRLIEAPALRASLAENGYRSVREHFTIEKTAREIEKIYESMTHRPHQEKRRLRRMEDGETI